MLSGEIALKNNHYYYEIIITLVGYHSSGNIPVKWLCLPMIVVDGKISLAMVFNESRYTIIPKGFMSRLGFYFRTLPF